MSNILYIPKANPLNFYLVDQDQPDKHLTKLYSDFAYRDTLNPWEEPTSYCQKMMKVDTTKLQFVSNYDPIQLDVMNADNISVITVSATRKLQDKNNPGFYAYEASITWSGLPSGIYFVALLAGGVISMISEPIKLSDIIENSLNFEYNNSRYHADVIPTGILFSFRVEGVIGRNLPGSTDQYYEDQRLNPALLSSKPFLAFKLGIGGTFGVPDWVVEKLNIIWSCNNVMIDGKSYAKSGDAKFSYNEEENYPMRGIDMEIRDGINRTSKIVTGDFDINKKLVVQYNINSRVFGGLGSDQTVVVTAFE